MVPDLQPRPGRVHRRQPGCLCAATRVRTGIPLPLWRMNMTGFALTVGGKAAVTRSTFDVLNPADESVVAACPQGTVELADQAVASARAAFKPWAALADAERVSKLLAIA